MDCEETRPLIIELLSELGYLLLVIDFQLCGNLREKIIVLYHRLHVYFQDGSNLMI